MSLVKLVANELKSIFSNPVILLTIFAGVIFYSLLYPLPYSHQTPREQEVTVVNLDNSQVSRQLERMVDATPQVKIVNRSYSIEEAKDRFLNGEVKGIFVIPRHFYKDLLLGRAPTVSYAGDASFFLVYGTIVEGLATATGTLSAQARVSRLVMEGEPISAASKHYNPVSSNLKPTFNPTVGYVDYVVPAVFVLILQQTLIMGVGLLGGTQKYGLGYWRNISSLKLVLVRSLIFVAIYYVMSMYYMGMSFDFYNISRLAKPQDVLLLLAPFLLTSSLIGVTLGAILPRRELVTVVVLVSSMPLIFSAGFIWPVESLPVAMVYLSNLFPCTPAIQSFLMVNQMGAEMSEITPQIKLMLGQLVVWGGIALLCYSRTQNQIEPVE
ncbi:ABC transporter permease [Vibrio sp. JC009]|uniref:ABC transporter permease n=1 Tax=Vibrio sp. JC009 TaxID=2912314 RepID=UPI0023AF3128|nr:ABC transporter permease [Vibrio sp. JC009]WED23213.1 ABC transporter permease [Vibrio sp. JC009]